MSTPVLPTWIRISCKSRFHPFGFIFESDRPARRFRGESEPLALFERVDFHNRAIGLICEIVPYVDRARGLRSGFRRWNRPTPVTFAARQPEFFQQSEKFRVFFQRRTLHHAGPIKNDAERTLRRDCWIELLQRTGRGISWICKKWKPGLLSLRIQLREAVVYP